MGYVNKELSIIIPTRNRLEKLKRALASIPNTIETIVMCDGDYETYHYLEHTRYDAVLVGKQAGSVWCRNFATRKTTGNVIYFCDDMEFHPGAIESAVTTFESTFPDTDGVVGFVLEPGEFHPTAVPLIGRRFIGRYPGKRPFFPEYKLFACQEVHWLANKLGKFVQDTDAKITHYHPAYFPELTDSTHTEGRTNNTDHVLMAQRERQGLIWGE